MSNAAGCRTARMARFMSRMRVTGALAVLVISAACGGPSSSSPTIALAPAEGKPASVEVRGLSPEDLNRIDAADLTPEQWAQVLRVAVSDDGPAMLGTYEVTQGAARF